MSKESEMIDPAGRCVHDRIERVATDLGYTNRWLCKDCHEEFFHLDLRPGKITVMEPMRTLRDEFAMATLVGLLAGGYMGELAAVCYSKADAMLEQRKKEG